MNDTFPPLDLLQRFSGERPLNAKTAHALLHSKGDVDKASAALADDLRDWLAQEAAILAQRPVEVLSAKLAAPQPSEKLPSFLKRRMDTVRRAEEMTRSLVLRIGDAEIPTAAITAKRREIGYYEATLNGNETPALIAEVQRARGEITRLMATDDLRPDLISVVQEMATHLRELFEHTANDFAFCSRFCNAFRAHQRAAQAEAAHSVEMLQVDPVTQQVVDGIIAACVAPTLIREPGALASCDPQAQAAEIIAALEPYIQRAPSITQALSGAFLDRFFGEFDIWAGVAPGSAQVFALCLPAVFVEAPPDLDVPTQMSGVSVQREAGALESVRVLTFACLPLGALTEFNPHFMPSDDDLMLHSAEHENGDALRAILAKFRDPGDASKMTPSPSPPPPTTPATTPEKAPEPTDILTRTPGHPKPAQEFSWTPNSSSKTAAAPWHAGLNGSNGPQHPAPL